MKGGPAARLTFLWQEHPNLHRTLPMKKLRLLLLVAVASLGMNACTVSPTAPDDCTPDAQDCPIKPVGGN